MLIVLSGIVHAFIGERTFPYGKNFRKTRGVARTNYEKNILDHKEDNMRKNIANLAICFL